MLERWNKRIVDQVSDVPCIIFFFHDFLQSSLQKSFQFIFLFFYRIIKIKSFECPKSIKSIKKIILGTSRLLVDDLFVQSSKRPSVLYCRLTDFKTVNFAKKRRPPFFNGNWKVVKFRVFFLAECKCRLCKCWLG